MKIVAIDTSCITSTVGILENGVVLAERMTNYKLSHSESIMPLVDGVFSSLKMDISDIDCIACAVGPGSFTGLRIGVATAKGLALATGKKIVPVPTLMALAYNIFDSRNIIASIIDARRGQVYFGFYRWENGVLTRLSDEGCMDLGLVVEKGMEIAKTHGGVDVVFVGDGAILHRETLEEKDGVLVAPLHLHACRGASVGALAFHLIDTEKDIFDKAVEPLYMKKSQAEVERELKLGGAL